ncbi:hypothetical protein SAMN05443428_1354 [Caloramator quimbayensis]|uniref:Uncharacterized protein n=1 Tax=Caloramator quimbayensis TaxID=1147123 RepID=A0A1T4YBZ3_9CLOT|nr:hypothetical protein [Caloramator quimbayensis]SKA99304.1 hypothetical protein SAMN05443428_1354 [Caloramator quimbayensis]
MNYTFSYNTEEEKENLIKENTLLGRHLIEVQNITEGNFLIFSDAQITYNFFTEVDKSVINADNTDISTITIYSFSPIEINIKIAIDNEQPIEVATIYGNVIYQFKTDLAGQHIIKIEALNYNPYILEIQAI